MNLPDVRGPHTVVEIESHSQCLGNSLCDLGYGNQERTDRKFKTYREIKDKKVHKYTVEDGGTICLFSQASDSWDE